MTAKATLKEGKGKKTFLEKLKSVCEKCTPASIKVYLRNILRLYRLLEKEGDIPLSGDWLAKKTLVEAYKKQPLKVRRHLSVAGVKASRAYKRNEDKWTILMYKDAAAYDRNRSKNKRSEKETASWPKGGIKAVKKASQEMWKRVKVLLREDKEPNLKTLYRYQMFIVLKLFSSDAPFRNTFASFSLKKGDGEGNYIEQPKKGNFTFVVNQHKASKNIGTKEVKLSRSNTMALRKFIKYRAEVPEVKHDFFLSNKKGAKMTKATLGKAVHRVTKELTGKSFGSRLIRVLFATDSKHEIDKVAGLQNKMLHGSGSKQTKEYTRN